MSSLPRLYKLLRTEVGLAEIVDAFLSFEGFPVLDYLVLECSVTTVRHFFSSTRIPPLVSLTLIIQEVEDRDAPEWIDSLEIFGNLMTIKTIAYLCICTENDVKLDDKDYGAIAQSLPNLRCLSVFPLNVSCDDEIAASLGALSLIAEHAPQLESLVLRLPLDHETLNIAIDCKYLPHVTFQKRCSLALVLSPADYSVWTAQYLLRVANYPTHIQLKPDLRNILSACASGMDMRSLTSDGWVDFNVEYLEARDRNIAVLID